MTNQKYRHWHPDEEEAMRIYSRRIERLRKQDNE